MSHLPTVTIGLPVYNGEDYLEDALRSILNQTYHQIEVVISDNGSTDRTREICEQFARIDRRIQYERHELNRGAGWNFNRVRECATGEFFKWHAHDDLLAPDCIEKCVTVMMQHPDVIICYSDVMFIDAGGDHLHQYDVYPQTDAAQATHRFHELLLVWHLCFEIFGVIRTADLLAVPPLGNYAHGDGILLERLALRGRFYLIPETLFFSRRHNKQSMEQFGVFGEGHNQYRQYTLWFDPTRKGTLITPTFRLLRERIETILQSSISLREQIICGAWLGRWLIRVRMPLIFDMMYTVEFLGRRLLQITTKRPTDSPTNAN